MYVWQGGALHAISPLWADEIWPSTTLDGWSGSGDLEYGRDGSLYVTKDNALHSISLESGSVTRWMRTSNDVFGLGIGREAAYMRIADAVYALEIGALGASPRLVD